MKFFRHLFLILLFSNLCYSSIDIDRETRAVWLTTNFQLDWPPNTYDENEQKLRLRAIFKDLSSRKFNTVYFQVRSNGSVIYNSGIEPFSPYFTGEVGVKPSYDPLQFAIELGKEFNLEVHAWMNMIRCFSGSDERFLKHPKHIRNRHPEWTIRVMDEDDGLSYWLNPGDEKVQDYLVNLLIEISGKYDIDGIHLDFFRYPGTNFNDRIYFNRSLNSVSISEWRRNNLTSILKKYREKVIPRNPYLKIGATPIGIRKNINGANGWEGYTQVYQDTETWLKDGLVDYLAPQIYWDLNKNPHFSALAKDWVKKSYNKNIVLGLAAYKDEVKPELKEMVKIAKEIGAAGVSFFRYGNIIDGNYHFFGSNSFPQNMIWKEQKTNFANRKLYSKYNVHSEDEIIISWLEQNHSVTNEFRTYALVNENKLIKLISLDKTKVKLKFGNPTKLMYNYNIAKLNRLWNSSISSNPLFINVPFLDKLKNDSKQNSDLIMYKLSKTNSVLAITSTIKQSAIVDVITKENVRTQKVTELNVGLNLFQVDNNIELLKSIIVTYSSKNKKEELNFF